MLGGSYRDTECLPYQSLLPWNTLLVVPGGDLVVVEEGWVRKMFD